MCAGLTRCTVSKTCVFAIADCSGGCGKALHGLHLRARFVGPAIFMPHLSLLDVPTNATSSAGNQTLLLASFCPPIAGSFSVDLRVLWWSPNPPSEERQVFLGAREGAGTNRKHHEIFLRCEAASRLPMSNFGSEF